jgi:hypothetical protein
MADAHIGSEFTTGLGKIGLVEPTAEHGSSRLA